MTGWPKGKKRGPQSPEHKAALSKSLRGRKHTPEQIAANSRGQKGKTLSATHKAKTSKTMTGRKLSSEHVAKMLGNRNAAIETPRYAGAHRRIRMARGYPSAQSCEVCGEPARGWALNHDATATLAEDEGKFAGLQYSLDPADYVAMCKSCHGRYDRGNLSI